MRSTIVIPTLNGDETLHAVIQACLAQSLPEGSSLDILVIDSGSTDGTVALVSGFPGVRLHQIPNAEFGHGRTRQMATELTDADVLIYLTQDAEPVGDRWAADLLEPLRRFPGVAAVYGRQVPRPGCRPTVARDVTAAFRRLGPSAGVVVHGAAFGADASEPASTFFSNVCSAVRRSVLVDIPFRDVKYAEDQALVQDLHAAGYLTAYAPLASVRHSHDLTLERYFFRQVDEFVGIRASTGRPLRPGIFRHVAAFVVHSAQDVAFAATDRSTPPVQRARRAVAAPAFQAARRVAIALAGSRLATTGVVQRLSLERRLKNRGR